MIVLLTKMMCYFVVPPFFARHFESFAGSSFYLWPLTLLCICVRVIFPIDGAMFDNAD